MNEELRAQLKAAGKQRANALTQATAASNQLRALVRTAHEAGMRPTEIVALTGLSRQAVYDITR